MQSIRSESALPPPTWSSFSSPLHRGTANWWPRAAWRRRGERCRRMAGGNPAHSTGVGIEPSGPTARVLESGYARPPASGRRHSPPAISEARRASRPAFRMTPSQGDRNAAVGRSGRPRQVHQAAPFAGDLSAHHARHRGGIPGRGRRLPTRAGSSTQRQLGAGESTTHCRRRSWVVTCCAAARRPLLPWWRRTTAD
jgi:hypothetical protein